MSLKIGEKAPSFSAKNQIGETISLNDFAGKKIVLYFYPKDNTPGCSAQACNIKDNYNELIAQNYVVLGVSPDDESSHQKFIDKFNLPFDLLVDTEKEICNSYGIWKEKKNFGKTYMGVVRTTFIIDSEGNIEDIIEKVKTKDHTSQILK